MYLHVRNKLKNAFVSTYTRQAFQTSFINISQEEWVQYIHILQFIGLGGQNFHMINGEAQKIHW